ncbi:hypothetical protein NLX71_06755 [Paenibacillus sp. MZ04-78.2]|uniref:hypothetical protein n=1 Tax=Paenibacillus sp. MZ04-78.2 TaxID=2962034 RepID=UPI0020B66CB3|nr:hypothetical protein [Paenibacillus sp. MZ04-78.2]MCP3773021.1 hypothetical protein [Paenibacillus sp. MZ04-78.2]
MNYTSFYVDLAQQYAHRQPISQQVGALAGGSVGRGEADRFSDLDLNVYTSNQEQPHYSANVLFQEHVIQLHVHPLPQMEQIIGSPWDFRFLEEARIVSDPSGLLQALITEASAYFQSPQGRERMLSQAKAAIAEHQAWLQESLDAQERITASFAADAVWGEAAMVYAYFVHGAMSTGGLLPIMRRLDLYPAYREIRFGAGSIDPDKLLTSLQAYRAYLRKRSGDADAFELQSVQDELTARKAARYKEAGDPDNLAWQLYAEAFWCYLALDDGQTLEQHVRELPEAMRAHLVTLGFQTYSEEQIHTLMKQAEHLIGLCEEGQGR